MKEKFYTTAIKTPMPYGLECWPIKKKHMHRMSVIDMRMFRWTYGQTRMDRIRDVHFREHLVAASMGDN